MIPAALLTEETCVIDDLPYIDDVLVLSDFKTDGRVVFEPGKRRMIINAANIGDYRAEFDIVRRMRASYYLLGALLGRFGRAEISFPGGCEWARPIINMLRI